MVSVLTGEKASAVPSGDQAAWSLHLSYICCTSEPLARTMCKPQFKECDLP